jgi:ParB family chromosome partitioning protein
MQNLKTTAEEIVQVCNLRENGLPIAITDDMDLTKFINEAITTPGLILPTDVFSEETQAVLDSFKKPKEKKKKDVIFIPEAVEEMPVDKPSTLVDDIKNAERLKELKDIALAEPQFKKIRGIITGFVVKEELRNVMLKMMEVPAEPTDQDMAEKMHQKIEDMPINSVSKDEEKEKPDLTPKEEVIDIPDEKHLLGRGMMKTSAIRTKTPFSDLFDINPRVLDEITKSMSEKGYDENFPITLWEDVVIDGHTRLSAAIANNIAEVPVYQKEFKDEQEALDYAIHNQRARRNLSEAELLRCIAVVDKPLTKAEAGHKGGTSNLKTKIAKDVPTHKKTAEVLGIGESKVSDARTVLADADASKAVAKGEKTITGAAKEIREKKSKKEKVVKVVLSVDEWIKEQRFTIVNLWTYTELCSVAKAYAIYYHKNSK